MNYELRKRYYSIIPVKYELLKAFKNREVVFMSDSDHSKCIRGLFISNIPFLNKVWDFYKFFEKDYNIYISQARYNKIPVFNWNLKERSQETGEFFRSGIYQAINEYDLLFDFDRKKGDKYTYQVINLANLFLKYGLKFNLYPSGTGFQLILFSENFNITKDFNPENENNYLNYVKFLAELFKNKFNLMSVDLSGVGAIAKIRKCEYSICKDIIVLPINHFLHAKNYDRFNIETVLNETIFKNRGLMIFNQYNTNIKTNFNKFIKDFLLFEEIRKWHEKKQTIIQKE